MMARKPYANMAAVGQ